MTTDEVLTEFLGFVSKLGPLQRSAAVGLCRAVLASSDVEVLQQTRERFLDALTLYERRSDKGYSPVDCSSMVAMRDHAVNAILSADRHFEQEGFELLMR